MSGWKNDRTGRARPPERRRRRQFALSLAGIWGLVLGGLVLAGCARHEPLADRSAAMLRLSQRNEPATLDPQLASLPDEFFIIRALSEGLLTPAPNNGAPQAAVAAHWSVSGDGLTYTFDLRRGVRWSNGDPVTADDFVYSIHRVLSSALGAPKASLFFPLRNAFAYYSGRQPDFSAVGVHAVNPHRLELTLDHPMADFLALVASGPWIPVHRATIEAAGRMAQRDTGWARPGKFVGNGPFVLADWRPAQEITVTRNPIYWNLARVHLPGIQFLAYDNPGSEERAFRGGQLDLTMDVPFSKLATYRSARPTVLHTIPLLETRFLAVNTTRPPLNDRRVRRALALAINRPALTDQVLQGGQEPAFSFIPPGLGGYHPQAALSDNAVEARRLLAEAGYPGGRGFPRLELTTWTNLPLLEAIQQMWHTELGVEIVVAQREARTHVAALAVHDFALALVPAIPDYASVGDLLGRFESGDAANYPAWRNAEFDRLVTVAARTAHATVRNAAYQQAERVLLDEMPVIPLYFNTQNFLLRPEVKNWRTDGLWTRFYLGVDLE